MNCLEYLLDLWERGHRFKILYNGDHCIGVNDRKIFELGSSFKRDLIAGFSLSGSDNFTHIENCHCLENLTQSFSLSEHYQKLAKEYYDFYKSEV